MSPATRPRDLPPTLGMTLVEGGAEFAVYAGHADSVEVCLYDADDRDGSSERRLPLTERTHGSWYGFLPGVGPGQRYGLRADGPWRPSEGLRYNPAKVLLDPYARAIEGDVAWTPEVFAHRVDDRLKGDDLVRSPLDSAGSVPRCVVVDEGFDWGDDAPPHTPLADTVVYEAHVRSLTMQHPDVPEHLRGTYAGLCHPAVIAHLKAVGATAVELLPVQAFASEPEVVQRGLTQLLGLQHARVLRPAREVRLDSRPAGRRRRVQGHGAAAARRGHRGDPRRGLQPHRRAVRAAPGRRCPGVAWTTAPTTGSTSAARTSTSPAAATPSTCGTRWSARWCSTRCATG